jgi:hypothetical protein
MELVYRPLHRRNAAYELARRIAEEMTMQYVMHCGILDVRNQLVFHFESDGWKCVPMHTWMHACRFGPDFEHATEPLYAEHTLADTEQLEVLKRAYAACLGQPREPYDVVFNNCQSAMHELVYCAKTAHGNQAVGFMKSICGVI